ncbi:MAG: LemA family protein [Thermonemataceae bacterium]
MKTEDQLVQYIEKLLELQQAVDNDLPSKENLKQIAAELNVAWEDVQKAVQREVENGLGYRKHRFWKGASEAFEHALSLDPYHQKALEGIVEAEMHLFIRRRNKKHRVKAEKYGQLGLQLYPGNKAVIAHLSKLNSISEKLLNLQWLWFVPILLFVMGGIYLFYLSPKEEKTASQAQSVERTPNETQSAREQSYNEVITLREAVLAQWAQVENVYQRRADLIPNLVATVKAAAQFEQEQLKTLLTLQQEVNNLSVNPTNQKALQDFILQQSKLSQQLVEIQQQLSTVQAFRDLQVQIEGAENRISVERKKYNEAVAQYNTRIQQAPYNTLGFKKIAYFQMDRKANQKPEIKF